MFRGRFKVIASHSTLNISETVRYRGLLPKDHHWENGLRGIKWSRADDVTWPCKVKLDSEYAECAKFKYLCTYFNFSHTQFAHSRCHRFIASILSFHVPDWSIRAHIHTHTQTHNTMKTVSPPVHSVHLAEIISDVSTYYVHISFQYTLAYNGIHARRILRYILWRFLHSGML